MAIKTKNRTSLTFNTASMTDIVFLLLIFFMICSTLISPNALKLLLPQSNNQTAASPVTTISITKDLDVYLETTRVDFTQLEARLQQRLKNETEPTIALHVDETVPMKEVVKVMNIARDNRYKLILATRPE